MDILERIAAYDCSDGGHSDAAQGSAYDLLADARAEIERLQEAKRGALSVADERSKENVGLRAEIERLRAALTKLSNEVLGSMPLLEVQTRRDLGNSNYSILIQRAEEARALLNGDEQAPEKAEKPLVSADGKLYCKRCDEYYTTTNRDYRCPYCQR